MSVHSHNLNSIENHLLEGVLTKPNVSILASL